MLLERRCWKLCFFPFFFLKTPPIILISLFIPLLFHISASWHCWLLLSFLLLSRTLAWWMRWLRWRWGIWTRWRGRRRWRGWRGTAWGRMLLWSLFHFWMRFLCFYLHFVSLIKNCWKWIKPLLIFFWNA